MTINMPTKVLSSMLLAASLSLVVLALVDASALGTSCVLAPVPMGWGNSAEPRSEVGKIVGSLRI